MNIQASSLPKKILVVDDISDLRLLVRKILENERHVVFEASTGFEALSFMRTHHDISLIIVDIMMPEMDGFELIEQINTNKSLYPQLKIIFLTGKRDKNNLIKAISLKADDYILKPIDPVLFKNKIRTLFNSLFIEDDFVWINEHFKATLAECVIQFPFTVIALCEAKFVIEADWAFKEGQSFAFHCVGLDKALSLAENEYHARVDVCEKKNSSRYQIFCSFIGNTDELSQKLRFYTTHYKLQAR